MNLITTHEPIDRIERFQSLQAGQYWRATDAIAEEGITAGMVLLLQSIRWVDETAHTIILRAHPSLFGQRTQHEFVDDAGKKRVRYLHFEEHRFLLNDFLAQFEFAHDHEEVRAAELAQAQARINELQQELVQAQRSPVLLAQIVEEGLAKAAAKPEGSSGQGDDEEPEDDDIEKDAEGTGAAPEPSDGPGSSPPAAEQPQKLPSPQTAVAHVAPVTLGDGTIASAIAGGITAEGIAALRTAAQREQQVATIKADWIASKTSAIGSAIKALTPFYLEQAAAAIAHTEDVRTHVAKLLDGIASLDLYVGKDVEVQTIREGASAPPSEPLTFVQRKLTMDVEAAIWIDVDEQFDFEDEGLFFDALRKHEGLVGQVFPTQRCVLVMAATQRDVDYGDRWVNHARNQENRKVMLMVRDGERIFRVFSPVESHLGSARLFPTKDDQKQIFRGWDGTQIRFEDVSYTDKLQAHERMALHYKRFLILACGLDHRLKLFGEFYPGQQSLNFVSLEFQQAHMRFLHDDEDLLPGPARPSVRAWLEAKNAFIRPGSRVLCNWFELMNPSTAPAACRADYGKYAEYEFRYKPTSRVSVALAQKDGPRNVVEVEVTGYSYSTHKDRTFQCKVNLSKAGGDRYSQGELSHLCLDAVEPDDLLWYVHNRGARRDHLTYIRFFKRALKHVQAERTQEEVTRARMLQALCDGAIGEPAERPSLVSQAVMAWRAANRGKLLPSDPTTDVWASLLDQMYMLAGEGKSRAGDVEKLLAAQDLVPLRLVLSGNAGLVAYAAPRAHEVDDRLEQHAWVHRISLERGSRQHLVKSQRWALLAEKAASETTLAEWPAAKEWAGRASMFASLERKKEVMEFAHRGLARLEELSRLRAPGRDLQRQEFARNWLQARRHATSLTKKFVAEPSVAVPIGLVRYPRTGEVMFVCVCTEVPEQLFAGLQDEAARRRLRAQYVEPYKDKVKAGARFDRAAAADAPSWVLATTPLAHMESGFEDLVHAKLGAEATTQARPGITGLLPDCFASWSGEESRYSRNWLASNVVDADGRLAVDAALGIELPPDFAPTRVQEITLQSKSADKSFHRWRDVSPARSEGDAKPGHGIGRDELEKLAGSVPVERTGYIRSEQVFATQAQAYAYASRPDADDDETAVAVWVRAHELPGAPLAPEGYERWYAVPAACEDTSQN